MDSNMVLLIILGFLALLATIGVFSLFAFALRFDQGALIEPVFGGGFRTPSASLSSQLRQQPRRSGSLIETAQTVSIESLVTRKKLLFRRSLTGCF